MQIYERIFDLLEKKGISQKELSEKTGIRQSTISDWKNKKINPSADKIMVVCDALEVSPYEILSGTDDRYAPIDYVVIDKKSDEYMLIEAYRNSTASQKDRLLGYVEALKH